MKNLFIKIETIINTAIYWLIDALFKFLKRITPPQLIEKIQKKIQPLKDKVEFLQYKLKQNQQRLSLRIEKFKNFKSNLKIDEKKSELKKFSKKLFSSWYIEKLKRLAIEKIHQILNWIQKQFQRFNQYHLLVLTITLFVGGFSFVNIFESTSRIVEKEYNHKDRKIASTYNQKPQKFPYYFGYDKKLSVISQLVIPAFIESTGRFHNLKVNFAIQFSNRTAKRFFDKYRYLFMDQLQVTLEPVLPSFPLTEEGKDIVRNKLFEELNHVLMTEKIDGRIKEVKITDIIAN